ncbi:MAG: hypothetical protein ACYTFK_03285 [Planctomycetota bacterium]
MMKLFKVNMLLICQFLVFGLISPPTTANYTPWDELTENCWIDFFDGNDPDMYPANADAADIDDSYTISFSQAGGGNKAKGMNALKFVHHGKDQGHLVSKDLAGSFELKNSGDHNTFTAMLIVVAINSESLKDDFTMQLNMRGQNIDIIDANDFVYYDNPYGRPSGYYSITDPNTDALTYAFDTGMVTVYGVEGMLPVAPEGSITIDYAFEDLPGPAVFSVYGFIGTDPEPSVYHTNKAFLDQNDLGGGKNKISTFAVTVPGDLDDDLDVDLTDFAILARNWLTGV